MEPLSPEERAQRGRLAMTHVGRSVRITRLDDYQYQLTVPRDHVSHVLHLILSLFTAGLWVVVWIFCILNARPERHLVLTVDEYGGIWRGERLWWHPEADVPVAHS